MQTKYPEDNSIRSRAVNLALEVLQSKHKVDQVCTDTLHGMSCKDITESFDQVVKDLVEDSIYWDGYYL